MKNILSNFTGIFAIFHPPLPALTDDQDEAVQQEVATIGSSTWARLMVLLNAQVQAGTMDVGESRQMFSSIDPEALDLALREMRCASVFSVNGLNLEAAPEEHTQRNKGSK